MKYGSFMEALKSFPMKSVYLLAGEEAYFIERAKAAIFDRLFPNGEEEKQDGLEVLSGDVDMDVLIGEIQRMPFFTEKNVIYVKDFSLFRDRIREEGFSSGDDGEAASREKAKSRAEDRFYELLADMPETTVLIFEVQKADKRRKIYKCIDKIGLILEADALRPWEIGDWLSGRLLEIGKQFDREARETFLGAVSMMQQVSLSYLDKELSKLALYTAEKRVGKRELMAVLSSLPELSAFALADAISEQRLVKALEILRRQLKDGVFPPLLISLLARHIRQLWQASVFEAQGIRGKKLGEAMGINAFIAEKLGQASRRFQQRQLKEALLMLTDLDYYLKTGQAEPQQLEDVLLRLCRKTA